ncbi:hypothetical protein QN224_31270 [Sinorhizobium sp. 8-89]|uniref:hypothetical protein n=1 Tax=Sinorhizobium sp. 7-81 TaxID=3049087 RepID=UPI0024C22BEA|nr:hypothetical protein [Sinorhizobium sp. 7-81]MDK1389824.1 hypothetical protein [Sinorhizobium sp. 7-81]
MTALAPHLTAFPREHLPHEGRASQHTCAAYAYSFQLLLSFAAARLGTTPSRIEIEQAEPAFVPAKVVDFASRDAFEAAMFVNFPNGVKVRIGSAAPSELAAAVMRALK